MLFFFNDTATTEIYTLSLHDALPISRTKAKAPARRKAKATAKPVTVERLLLHGLRAPAGSQEAFYRDGLGRGLRSEEHTSELQSQSNLVCRLLLEQTKTNDDMRHPAS